MALDDEPLAPHDASAAIRMEGKVKWETNAMTIQETPFCIRQLEQEKIIKKMIGAVSY